MKRIFKARTPAVALACLSLMALAGCATGPFHTAASMRVDVEVYKGPLSKQPAVQWSELTAVISEVGETLVTFDDGVLLLAQHEGFIDEPANDVDASALAKLVIDPHAFARDDPATGNLDVSKVPSADTRVVSFLNGIPVHGRSVHGDADQPTWCGEEIRDIGSIFNVDSSVGCLIMAQLHADTLALAVQARNLHRKFVDLDFAEAGTLPQLLAHKDAHDALINAANFSARLKAKAFYWAEAFVPAEPWKRTVRTSVANFANLTASYGNQIVARVDALVKQVDIADRTRLPLSVYLREVEPTDFLNLYAWKRATGPAQPVNILYHPIDSFSMEETMDRVRVVERLFADENWSKINTVYASGQGDVSMALIKDDIGNWNLKSFDSDPSDLLNAYKNLTLAGVRLATDAAQAAATGGSSAALESALGTASRVTRGRFGASQAPFDVAPLRDRVIAQLEALRDEDRASDAIEKAKSVLHDHGVVLDALLDVVASGADTSTEARPPDQAGIQPPL